MYFPLSQEFRFHVTPIFLSVYGQIDTSSIRKSSLNTVPELRVGDAYNPKCACSRTPHPPETLAVEIKVPSIQTLAIPPADSYLDIHKTRLKLGS